MCFITDVVIEHFSLQRGVSEGIFVVIVSELWILLGLAVTYSPTP